MPDFAGVALVDILANGVAMLIIVIVMTIAARMEREERYAEQADEVAAVMSHKFSTSLVLNSLAASPPARLHDYDTSPLDQVLDPELLPILELHPGFVREFYTGTIWTRRDLLEEHNALWSVARRVQRRAQGAPAGGRLRHSPVLSDDVDPARARHPGLSLALSDGSALAPGSGALPAGRGREGLSGRGSRRSRSPAPARPG